MINTGASATRPDGAAAATVEALWVANIALL
jgi:hypothetical protein